MSGCDETRSGASGPTGVSQNATPPNDCAGGDNATVGDKLDVCASRTPPNDCAGGDNATDGLSPASSPAGREQLLLGLVLLFATGLFAGWLGAGSLWDVDEPRYAQMSREILRTGDPVTMHLNGRPWVEAPPLWMWLQAAAGRGLGFTEFAARMWAAVFGVIGVAGASALGRELFGVRTGLLSGLILATMLEYLLLARLAVPDVMDLAFMLLALHAFYRGYRDRVPSRYLWCSLYLGLATLTRGPGAAALFGVVCALFLADRRAFGRLREIPWGWMSAIFLGVAAPWYALEAARVPEFLTTAFNGDAVVRLYHYPGAQATSLLYDLPVLILGAVPWTAFLPVALAYHYRGRWHDGSLLCLLWCGVMLGAAVVLGGQHPDEVVLIYPLAAIMVARLWEEFLFEGAGRLRRALVASFVLQLAVVVFLAVTAGAFATIRYPLEFAAVRGALIAPLLVLVAGPAVSAVLFRLRRYTAAFLALPATMAVFIGVLSSVTVPVVETQKAMRPFSEAIRREIRAGDRIIGYQIGTLYSLVYYTDHDVEWIDDPTLLAQALCARGRVFLVTTPGALTNAREAIQGQARTLLAGRLRAAGARGTMVLEVKSGTAACAGTT